MTSQIEHSMDEDYKNRSDREDMLRSIRENEFTAKMKTQLNAIDKIEKTDIDELPGEDENGKIKKPYIYLFVDKRHILKYLLPNIISILKSYDVKKDTIIDDIISLRKIEITYTLRNEINEYNRLIKAIHDQLIQVQYVRDSNIKEANEKIRGKLSASTNKRFQYLYVIFENSDGNYGYKIMGDFLQYLIDEAIEIVKKGVVKEGGKKIKPRNPKKSKENQRHPKKSKEIQRNPKTSKEIQRNPKKPKEIHKKTPLNIFSQYGCEKIYRKLCKMIIYNSYAHLCRSDDWPRFIV